MSFQPKRGEVWLANLSPVQGSEQAGTRPVIIFQNDLISQFSATVIEIPLTTNLRRAQLPTCLRIARGDGGLSQDSVALCYQIRALDKQRLQRKIGTLQSTTLDQLATTVLLTLGY